MKKHGHYCKVCGEYKASEKFSGKGYAAHICKSCASLPPEKRSEQMMINRIINLPWRLSKEQISWLKNRIKDKRAKIRELAKEQYAQLLEEKKKTYAEYRRSRGEMRELLTAKANVDRLLNMEAEHDAEKEKDHGQL